MQYILASGSPRRKELLKFIVPEFEIIPAVSEEKITAAAPAEIVEQLSFQKASEIFYKIFTDKTEPYVVIGADTIVSFNHRILGKPKNREDARSMIRSYQGSLHEVYTGVTFFYTKEGKCFSHTFHEMTVVDVAKMSDKEIESYIATGDADDKAGAYGVQGQFAVYIKGIKGDFYNVMGLPVARLYREMKDKGLL